MGTRLTLRRLNAIEGALAAILAGETGEGDWPKDATFEDMAAAHHWVCEQIERRTKR